RQARPPGRGGLDKLDRRVAGVSTSSTTGEGGGFEPFETVAAQPPQVPTALARLLNHRHAANPAADRHTEPYQYPPEMGPRRLDPEALRWSRQTRTEVTNGPSHGGHP